MQLKEYWIVKGRVTHPNAHDYEEGVFAPVGITEWQISDGPPGERTSSADYLCLETAIKAHAPAIFHFVDEDTHNAD
jgi:hypothetical protein